MAIRPVEVQGVVQRSQDIGQLKQNQDQKPLLDQSNLQTQFRKEGEQNSRQVTKYNDADKKENRYDAKEKGHNSFYGENKKRQKESDEEKDEGMVKVKSIQGSFDVKI